jgi:hypothetical protein
MIPEPTAGGTDFQLFRREEIPKQKNIDKAMMLPIVISAE